MNRPLLVRPSLVLSLISASFVAYAAPAESLPEVRVQDRAETSRVQTHSSTATKTDTPLQDIPQAISVVDRQQLDALRPNSMADVLRYVAGVGAAQGEGNRDTAVFRGNSSTGDFFIDGARDDVQYYRDFYDIERIEVLKGANAMIFGRGGAGGVINRVSRTADGQPVHALALTLGQYRQKRATLDWGERIDADLAVRLSALKETSESYRKSVDLSRSGVHPVLGLKLGASTFLSAGAELFEDERTTDRGIPSYMGRPLVIDASTFVGDPAQSRNRARVKAGTLQLEQVWDNGLSLRNLTRWAHYDKYYQNVFSGAVDASGTRINLSAYRNATDRVNLFNQTDLNYRLDLAGMSHRLAGGIEWARQDSDNRRLTGYFTDFGANATSMSVPVQAPSVHAAVQFRPAASDANNRGLASVQSVYLQDQLEFSPAWQLIAGVRQDRFAMDVTDRRTGTQLHTADTPLSPRLGLVYKPVPTLSTYLSSSQAYVPRSGDQLSSLNVSNSTLAPETFRNLEWGMKWAVTPRFSSSLALYQLDRNNMAITDPADATRLMLIDGQRSRGLEWEAEGALGAQTTLTLSYAWQQARLTKDQSASIRAGNTLAQVPTHSGSAWIRTDWAPEWGSAVGIVARSAMYAAVDNAVRLPGFARLDAALFARISPQLKVQANLENLLDTAYTALANSNNNLTPGAPRTLRVTLTAQY